MFDEYEKRVHTIVSGTISREERGMIIVSLGRGEAILPREEQIPGEIYRPGSSLRAYLMKVEKKGQRVRLVLSRTHVNFVRELFFQEVPEIADCIEIKGIVRGLPTSADRSGRLLRRHARLAHHRRRRTRRREDRHHPLGRRSGPVHHQQPAGRHPRVSYDVFRDR